jgi:signal transduction histidine kinase
VNLQPALLGSVGSALLALGLGWALGRRRRPESPPPRRPLRDEHDLQVPEAVHRFMAKVIHALHNPLTGVLMSAEMLQEEMEPEVARRAAARVLEQGRQLREILRRIQEGTSLEACHFHLDLEAVDLGTLLRETLEDLEPRAAVKGQRFEVADLPPGFLAVGDRAFIRPILGELLSNAVKFAPLEARIQLGGEQDGDLCRVWVRNGGTPIPAGARPALFEPFARLTTPPTGGETTLGLGLWTARVRAEALGGTLREEPLGPGQVRFVLELLRAHVQPGPCK